LKNALAAPFGVGKRSEVRIYSRAESLGTALCLGLRLFEIVPDDFIAVFRLAHHPP
jgi:hypothetical protein